MNANPLTPPTSSIANTIIPAVITKSMLSKFSNAETVRSKNNALIKELLKIELLLLFFLFNNF